MKYRIESKSDSGTKWELIEYDHFANFRAASRYVGSLNILKRENGVKVEFRAVPDGYVPKFKPVPQTG